MHFPTGCNVGDIYVHRVFIEMIWVTSLWQDWWQLIAEAKCVGWSTRHSEPSYITMQQSPSASSRCWRSKAAKANECSWLCLIMAADVFSIMSLMNGLLSLIWLMHKGFSDTELWSGQFSVLISYNYCSNTWPGRVTFVSKAKELKLLFLSHTHFCQSEFMSPPDYFKMHISSKKKKK